MENKKYKVSRDNIFVGTVAQTENIYRYLGEKEKNNIKKGDLFLEKAQNFRTMLFCLNQDKLANDLLYRSPNYPVLNLTNENDIRKNFENHILIHQICHLKPLLELAHFNNTLTYEDILKIKEIVNQKYIIEHSALFGYQKLQEKPETFYEIGTSLLPKKYFPLLYQLGKKNAFKPPIEEGPIRKLKK